MLSFGTHSTEHPYIHYIDSIEQLSMSVDTFFKRNKLDPSKYNFWNFDIQGAELLALKGSVDSIQYADAIYLEVNTNYLYKDCALLHEIDQFLSDHNFERVLLNMTSHQWGDALYLRKNK